MANAPVATPPPPTRPPRSIAGPVVLILLGVLFLLGTMGRLSWQMLGTIFAHYWPLLLILWGVVKLAEHERAKRAGMQSRGIGVGGVFLVLFIIVAGLIATQAARVNWGDLRNGFQIDDQDFEDIFGGSTFDYSDELSQDLPPGASLRINDERGTVTVNVAEGKTMKVSVRKKIRTEQQKDADQYNTQTKPQITVNDKIVTLNANTQGAGDKGVQTDMDVYVPSNVELVIQSGRGDVSIQSMKANATVNHQRGAVTISDHGGNVTLNMDRSSAQLDHIKGDVTIQGKLKEVSVEDVDGTAHLNGEFQESVRLARIAKTVGFKSSRTDMEFGRLDGRLDLDSGDLRAASLFGPMRLITRAKDISLDGFSGDLRLENSNGDVDIGLLKPGNLQIDNRKGDVQITIPPTVALKVDARMRGGDIESDFNDIKVEGDDHQASANGSIGSNGSRLVINAQDGTIQLRKGTVAESVPAPPAVPKPPKPSKALPAPRAAPVESEN